VAWEDSLLPVVTLLLGVAAGHISSEFAARRQWARTAELEMERSRREDARRWDADRVASYLAVKDESLKLMTALTALAPIWERDDEAPGDLMNAFEAQRDIVAEAHMRAKMLASATVRRALEPLWFKTLEVGKALDKPPEGTTTADELTQRLATEVGRLLGEFDNAVASELGTDVAAAHTRHKTTEDDYSSR
jgi:hypothetical protein